MDICRQGSGELGLAADQGSGCELQIRYARRVSDVSISDDCNLMLPNRTGHSGRLQSYVTQHVLHNLQRTSAHLINFQVQAQLPLDLLHPLLSHPSRDKTGVEPISDTARPPIFHYEKLVRKLIFM